MAEEINTCELKEAMLTPATVKFKTNPKNQVKMGCKGKIIFLYDHEV